MEMKRHLTPIELANHELSNRDFWDCVYTLDYLEGTNLNIYGWDLREYSYRRNRKQEERVEE